MGNTVTDDYLAKLAASGNKYARLISKLNRLTKEGQVEWNNACGGPPVEGTFDEGWNCYFETTYMNSTIGFGEVASGWWNEDFEQVMSKTFLRIIFYNKDLAYNVDDVPGMDQLLDSIKYKLTDVENILDRLLAGE